MRFSISSPVLVAAMIMMSLPSTASSTTDDQQQQQQQQQTSCFTTDHPDRMTSLPGFNQPLPSKWYSGYLDYDFQGQQIHTHYILVEAEEVVGEDDNDGTSNSSSDDKPLIYWSNGGPGASSLFGLLTELGPLMLSDLSLETEDYKTTGIPTPIYNPYAWSRLGSLLIIDQPAPVGFSYCNNDTDSSTTCSDISWTDELASQNSYVALQTFFATKFPCLAQNKELYLTGESYGGIYIPTLAREIVRDADNNKLALKGFAVGDGCLGTETSICGELSSAGFHDYWHAVFMAGHHQIPWKDFEVVMRACSHKDQANFLIANTKDDEQCKKALAQVKKELGGFFEYSLYDDCTYRNGLLRKQRNHPHLEDFIIKGGLNDYPCGGGPVMEDYVKLDVVQKAFHVVSDFFEVDNAEGFDYTPTEPDLTDFYKEINGKMKVLIYNGDTDPAITSFAAHNWTSHMGFGETIDGHWRPWTVDGCQRMGGYVTRYEGDFDFVTIRGAGHMVPTYKPAATFAFLKAWIDGVEYPTFDVNCTAPGLSAAMTAMEASPLVDKKAGDDDDGKEQDKEVAAVDTASMLRG